MLTRCERTTEAGIFAYLKDKFKQRSVHEEIPHNAKRRYPSINKDTECA
ncbi:hypothetical protein TGDOM2_401060, partial [Toxoplasma gondii GAB2-2007-GAL-DOM2]